MDPRTLLALLCAAGFIGIALEGPTALAVFCCVCATPFLTQALDRRWLRRGAVVVVLTIWSTALSQGLFYAEQPRVAMFSVGPFVVWREGLWYGLSQSLRLVALTLAGLAVAMRTPPDRLHAAFRSLGMPFGLALMTSAALRFLPTVTREIGVVRSARAARGRQAWRRSPGAWLRLELGLLRPVLARAWRRAHVLAESLDARGFDPVAPRVERRPLIMTQRDWSVVVMAGLIAGSVVTARMLHLLYTTEVWYHPTLRPLYGFVRVWM